MRSSTAATLADRAPRRQSLRCAQHRRESQCDRKGPSLSETVDRRTVKRHGCNLQVGCSNLVQKREQSCTDSFQCNQMHPVMLRRGLRWNASYHFFGVGTGTPAIFTLTAPR
jgi:hypothetical protein